MQPPFTTLYYLWCAYICACPQGETRTDRSLALRTDQPIRAPEGTERVRVHWLNKDGSMNAERLPAAQHQYLPHPHPPIRHHLSHRRRTPRRTWECLCTRARRSATLPGDCCTRCRCRRVCDLETNEGGDKMGEKSKLSYQSQI